MTAAGELAPTAALPAPAAALAPRHPTGTDPDAVRDWFEFETIVDLPAPAASFAEAEAAAADYRRAARAENTRRAYRAAVAAFTEWCAAHRQTALPAVARNGGGVSRGRGGQGARRQHLAAAPRGVALSAPARRIPAADRLAAGIGDLCRHPPRPPPAVTQKDRAGARPAARRRAADPRHLARAARPRAAARRVRRGAAPQRTGGAELRAPDPPRGRHRPVPAVAQERPGGARNDRLAAGRQDRSVPGQSPRSLAFHGRDHRGPAVPPAVAAAAAARAPGERSESR